MNADYIPSVWVTDTKTGISINTSVRELEKRYAAMEQKLGLRPPSVSYASSEDEEPQKHVEDYEGDFKEVVPHKLELKYADMEKELWKPVNVEVANIRRSGRRGALKVLAVPFALLGGAYVVRGIVNGDWDIGDLPSYFHDLITGGHGANGAVHVNLGGLVQTPEYISQVPEQMPVEILEPEPQQGHVLSIVNVDGQNCGLLHDAAQPSPVNAADVKMEPDEWAALKADGKPFAVVAVDPDNHKHIDFSGMVNPNCDVVTRPNEG